MTTLTVSPNKFTSVFALLGACLLPAAGHSQGSYLRSGQPVDDEPRGYCFDVAGFGPEFRLDEPLRTHSCKFDGANEDQLYEWTDAGQIRMPEFDRCVTAEEPQAGRQLSLRPCADAGEQVWSFAPDGRLSPQTRPDLCVTLAAERSYAGTPSWVSPVYHMRQLALQAM